MEHDEKKSANNHGVAASKHIGERSEKCSTKRPPLRFFLATIQFHQVSESTYLDVHGNVHQGERGDYVESLDDRANQSAADATVESEHESDEV